VTGADDEDDDPTIAGSQAAADAMANKSVEIIGNLGLTKL